MEFIHYKNTNFPFITDFLFLRLQFHPPLNKVTLPIAPFDLLKPCTTPPLHL